MEHRVFPDVLKDIHKSMPCFIVGKGASLEFLNATHFGYGIIIAINQSVLIVQDFGLRNSIYSIQKDGKEDMVQPNKNIALILQAGRSDTFYLSHPWRFVINSDPAEMSIITAIDMALWMGCVSFTFLCCDSLVSGDLQTHDPVTRTTEAKPYREKYRKHTQAIMKKIRQTNFTFVTPEKQHA